jgi:hypothetical protein
MSIEDIAQEREAAAWERINSTGRAAPPEFKPGDEQYGPELCEECDDKMPPERRARGRHFCTECTDLLKRHAFQLGQR